jgi:hypothetical protein
MAAQRQQQPHAKDAAAAADAQADHRRKQDVAHDVATGGEIEGQCIHDLFARSLRTISRI